MKPKQFIKREIIVMFYEDLNLQRLLQQIINLKMNCQNKKQKVTAGRWTRTEHDKFMDALQKYGRDWVKVQKKVKTRTLLQIRSHAQKVFLNMSEEDVKAFIGFDEDSSCQFERVCLQNQEKEYGTKNKCASLKVKKTTDKSGCGKKEDESSCDLINTENSSKIGSETTEGNLNIESPKIVVSQVSNKSPIQAQANLNKNQDSVFLQMIKENQGHFLMGGDFLGLVWNQVGFQSLCIPYFPQFPIL